MMHRSRYRQAVYGLLLLTSLYSVITFVLAQQHNTSPSSSTSSSSPSSSLFSSSLSSLSPSFTTYLWRALLLLIPCSAFYFYRQSSPTSTSSSSITDTIPIIHFNNPTLLSSHHANSTQCSDIVIIGAGVAGSILALSLSRRGYTVQIIERDLSTPHRIVGELLQPGGVNLLHTLGLSDALSGYDAQIITGYTILFKDEILRLLYPSINGTETRETGRSFHHGRFIQKLRDMIGEEERCSLIQGTVTKLIEDPSSGRIIGVEYDDSNKTVSSHYAALTVVADGCLSVFRRDLITTKHQKLSSFLGLILKDCDLPTPLNGHVILADPSPILAYPISSTERRMLIDFPNGTLPADKAGQQQYLQTVIRPQLPSCLLTAFDRAVNDGHMSSMPNQSLPSRPRDDKRGVLVIGDALNMRHPLTGGGMTVAINDIVHLLTIFSHHHYSNTNDTVVLDECIQYHYHRRDDRVKVINILADALYAVFTIYYPSLRSSCFSYLSLHTVFSNNPIKLLSGLSSSQLLLIQQYAQVAMYGILTSILPYPTPNKIMTCCTTLRDACRVILPLLVKENNNMIVRGIATIIRWIVWI